MKKLLNYLCSVFLCILTLGNSDASELALKIPTPVYMQNTGELSTANGTLITFASEVLENDTVDFLTSRLAPATQASITSESVRIHFCDLTTGTLCKPEGLVVKQFDITPNETGDLDEYLVSTLLDPSSNEISGISISARSVSGYNYALDWIIASIDTPTSTLMAIEMHDYPAFTERSLHTTDMSPDLAQWVQYIDAAATLRIRELAISWLKDRKVTVTSSDLSTYSPELFSTISPFIEDALLMNSIVKYGKKRGVEIIPSLPHFSSYQLNNYYPDWMTPNGRAIDWRNPGPQLFLDAMISSAMNVDSVESISIWADEGGVTDRQVDFITQLTETVERVRTEVGRNIRLRFMLTPIISSAIRSGAITDLASLLPTNTIIDIYAGVGSDIDPGTYHLVSPTLPPSAVEHILQGSAETDFAGVGFVKRSRFNDIPFPKTTYFDKFLEAIKSNGGIGNFMYMGPSYESIFEPSTAYLTHRLWSGLGPSSTNLLTSLPDQGWFNTVPTVSKSWENLMITALSHHFQRIKVRLDGAISEPERNYENIKLEVASGVNRQRIASIDNALTEFLSTISNSDMSGVSSTSMRNIQLTELVVKQIVLLRELAEHDVLLSSNNQFTLGEQQSIAAVSKEFFQNCESLNRFAYVWVETRHIPICTYLPVVNEVRSHYNLPTGSSSSNILEATYSSTDVLPTVINYREFKNEYKQRVKNDLRLLDYVELPSTLSEEYGYGPFDSEHPEAVAFVFSADSTNSFELHFELFDVDSASEITMYVNGVQLSSNNNDFITVNQQWGAENRLTVPSSLLSESSINLVEFRNTSGLGELTRKFIWGVRNVQLVQTTEHYLDAQGYASFDRSSPAEVNFTLASNTCIFQFRLYDIDKPREVLIQLNEVNLPITITATENRSWSNPYRIDICEADAYDSELNVVSIQNVYFRQSGRAHIWGVGDVFED